MKKIIKDIDLLDKNQKKFLKEKFNVKNIEDVNITILKRLKENIKKGVTDVRCQGKICYKLWDIIVCVILANFANIYDWEDIEEFVKMHYKWLRTFLQMTGGIPSYQTFERVFSLIDYKELEKILVDFYQNIIFNSTMTSDVMCIDGRVDRGSSRNQTDYSDEIRPLNSLNVFSNLYGICLASEMIDVKNNEMHAVERILDRINVKGSIITWDALNTQTFNVQKVVDKKADYVVPIKANQGNFYNDLKDYFDEKELEMIIAGKTKTAYIIQSEKSHSSYITYEYFQAEDVDWYFDKEKWKKLKSIGLVKKTIEKNNKITVEKRYYISSLNLDIINFSKAIRMHWLVENKLHWHLDFTFREDDNTTVNKQALMNLQLINKFTLATLNRVKPFYNKSLKKIRTHITFNYEENFLSLLTFLALT